MDDSERDRLLTEIHTHVVDLRVDTASQDARITTLEHWRTGIVASCTSMFSALGMYFKMGGGSQ